MLKIKAQTGMEGFRSPEEQTAFNAQENQKIVLAMMDQATDLFNKLSTPGNTATPNEQTMQAIMTVRTQLGNLYGMLNPDTGGQPLWNA